jgi:hypothetical protein
MSEETLDYDTVLDLCRSKQRLIALAFDDESRQLTVADLAKAVVGYDHGTPLAKVANDVLEEVTVELHHDHVPKLVDAGVVEYDHEGKLVEPTEGFGELQPALSTVVDADPELGQSVAL